MRPRRLRHWLAGAVAPGAVLIAAGPAGAVVTIGSDLRSPPTGTSGCGGGPGVTCVIMQRSLPERLTASPIDGLVTRFRIRGGGGTARVRIVRPGPSGFTFVSATPYATGSGGGGITEYPVQIPIRRGDFVALDAAPGAQASFRALSGATAEYFEPSPPDGATASPTASLMGNEFLYNADVEPDEDGDGFGDDTQDGCRGNGTTTGECPAPEPGKSVNAEPVKGTVRVKSPGGDFVEWTGEGQIPVGALVDATKGTVRLTSAADLDGKTQTGDFFEGVFKIGQKRESKPVTELTLSGDLTCGRRSKAQVGAAARKRRLWGRARGRFRTRGRRSSAAVRGTTWLVEDRCDATFTRVKDGRVDVRDFRRKRTIALRAGQSYLAR